LLRSSAKFLNKNCSELAATSITFTRTATAKMTKTASTLVVFDWDNTLYPTTKVRQGMQSGRGKLTLTQLDLDELALLSECVYSMIDAYISLHSAQNIRIVTSAERGWIETSLWMLDGVGWWSAIYKLLFDPVNPIEMVCPSKDILPFKKSKDVIQYKLGAFRNFIRVCRPSLLISIGDSRAEYLASKKSVEGVKGVSVGRIKLKTKPSLSCMAQQTQFIMDQCNKLAPKDFDLEENYIEEKNRN